MEKSLLVFKNGQVTSTQQKPFLFELAMEGYIADYPAILSNAKLGLEEPEVMDVEEKIATNCRIDILMRYTNDAIAVVELKNVLVDDKALQQLIKYLQIKQEELKKKAEGDEDTSLIGILVGPEIDNAVKQNIEANGSLQGFLIYGVELQRYYDEGSWYIVTNWYAPKPILGKKDHTKYILNGNKDMLLGKGRLVYKVIEDYMAKNYGVSFADLQKIFPDTLRKVKSIKVKHHVVELEVNVDPQDRYARYFRTPLICSDGNVVVSSQWGIGNIASFIEHSKTLGYIIEEVKHT